jgi:DNA repair protein RAD50
MKTLEAECHRHERDISNLMEELGGRDLEALRRDVEACRKQTSEMLQRRAFREGSLNETRAQLATLDVELGSPLYANIEQRHREAVIKHESSAYAAKDLGRYHGALDKALMKFHSLKMAEINKSIREYWQKVYRGRDIDYIAIRSDTDESPADAAGGPRGGAVGEDIAGRALRSYNYRVVMVCGDAEMDMRGRCSAGQRVLASIIVRLAMADTFCNNCGVLALDEPTTNLDVANIDGLAGALADLIDIRRNNSRFQLILITHDETFVSQLSQKQVADWYYYISKEEGGCSKMERRNIKNLSGP